MKKSLLALAVLGAFASAASAQSSVTLYGTVDMAGRFVKNDGASRRLSLATNGINSSQLGFRGVEDLGGGLKAGFNLLADLAPIDSGNVGGKFFGRRATVSLFSGAGELRLGRDYVPTFWNETIFDAFGTNGLGSSLNVARYTHVRSDNSIGYFLPSNLGGFYGQLMVSAAEKTVATTASATTGDKPGRYIGGRFGFGAGPFNIAVAASQVRFGAASAPGIIGEDKVNTYNVGGSWDFGFLKLLGYYNHVKLERAKENLGSISAVIPFGQSEIHVGGDYDSFDPDGGSKTKVYQLKATYQYNLSKRTAMYGTASYLNNRDNTTLAIPGGYANEPGGKSKGFELGVRHFF